MRFAVLPLAMALLPLGGVKKLFRQCQLEMNKILLFFKPKLCKTMIVRTHDLTPRPKFIKIYYQSFVGS